MGTCWIGQCHRCNRSTSFGTRIEDTIYCDRCMMGYNGPPPQPKPYSHYAPAEELIARITALDAICEARRRKDHEYADHLWDAYWRKYEALDKSVDLRPPPPPAPPPRYASR